MYDFLGSAASASPAVLLANYGRKEILSLLELALWEVVGPRWRDVQ